VTCLPNFFLVGAAKAGTTSLFHYLRQHPDIYMSPVKEPCFFAPEALEFAPHASGSLVLDWHDYLALFTPGRGERAVGEASVAYLASAGAAAAIRARLPRARILMMLRDPADRLFAHYVAARAAGATTLEFGVWMDEEVRQEAERKIRFGPVSAGRYAMHLRRYRDVFPASQMHVLLFDDYSSDTRSALAGIFAFLDVDSTFAVDFTRHHNVTRVPRWPLLQRLARPVARRLLPGALKHALRPWTTRRPDIAAHVDDRRRAIALYSDDIAAVEAWLDRPLPAWRHATPPSRPAQ
jgi:hypothetical protein